FGNAKLFRQERHQRLIGFAIHRRLGDADLYRAVVLANHFIPAGARLQIAGQQQVLAITPGKSHQCSPNRICRNWISSSTMIGLRSKPPIGRSSLRGGAMAGSVICVTTRTWGLYGSGATPLRITRASTVRKI